MMEEIHALEQRTFHHDPASAAADAAKILAGLGFSPTQINEPLSTFSGGWQMRAHIARLLLEQPDLLMLDEPTNHLDLESINWLEQFLSNFAGALIIVSHDRHFLDLITTRTAWLGDRRIRSYAGNYSEFLASRELEEEQQLRRYENQQQEIAHIQQFIDRFRYKASKASAVQSRVKMLEKMERLEPPSGTRRVRLRIPDPSPVGRPVLELRNVSKSYGDNHVFSEVDLKVDVGEKVALVGPNGAGKSTLLKICAGVLDHAGTRILHPKTALEYFAQHRLDNLNPDASVLEEARAPGSGHTDEELRTILGCFLFSGDDVHKQVIVLSGGEKSRLAFARMLLRRGNLLLLDEPTNHLDISTREILARALSAWPGTLMMISHDRHFISLIADRIIEVGGGGIRSYMGSYGEYLARKAEMGEVGDTSLRSRGQATSQGALAAIEAAKAERRENREEAALSRRERAEKRNEMKRRINELQADIERMEIRLAEIHALQSDPDAYSSGKITPELAQEGRSIERELPECLDEWESLVEEYEEFRSA